jgi:anti-anti-sigma factor
MGSHASVVLDLRRLAFIDSSGIGLLIKAHQAETATVHTVVAPGSQVDRVFVIAGIDRVLPIFSDLDEALAALAPPPPRKKTAA